MQVEECGACRVRTTARTGGPSGGAGTGSASVALSSADSRDGERRDDFDLRREGWTGDALSEQR